MLLFEPAGLFGYCACDAGREHFVARKHDAATFHGMLVDVVVAAMPTRPPVAFELRRDLLAVELENRFGHRWLDE